MTLKIGKTQKGVKTILYFHTLSLKKEKDMNKKP